MVTIKGLLERIIIRILTTADSWQVMLHGLNDLPLLLVEGAGGLLVPITEPLDMAGLAERRSQEVERSAGEVKALTEQVAHAHNAKSSPSTCGSASASTMV